MANRTICQPAALSKLNVAVANRAPDARHNDPVCTPVLPAVFTNRTPVTCPDTDGVNRTPSSTEFGSVSLTVGTPTEPPNNDCDTEVVVPMSGTRRVRDAGVAADAVPVTDPSSDTSTGIAKKVHARGRLFSCDM